MELHKLKRGQFTELPKLSKNMGKISLLVIGRFGFFLLAGNSMLIVEINTKHNNENSTNK